MDKRINTQTFFHVTGRSSGTHIYSEVAPFLYLAINSVFHLILVPSFPRFAACRCAFPASSATSSVTVLIARYITTLASSLVSPSLSRKLHSLQPPCLTRRGCT